MKLKIRKTIMETHYQKIYSGNFIIVRRIVEALKDAGISAIVKDEDESGRLAGFMPAISGFQVVYVHKDEIAKAQPVVEQISSEMEA